MRQKEENVEGMKILSDQSDHRNRTVNVIICRLKIICSSIYTNQVGFLRKSLIHGNIFHLAEPLMVHVSFLCPRRGVTIGGGGGGGGGGPDPWRFVPFS